MAPPKHLKSRFRMGFVGLVVGALALTGVAPARQAYHQDHQVRELQATVEALEERNEKLTGRLERLSDVAYMEKLAREKLGVVRPGETSYVVVPAPPTDPEIEASDEKSVVLRERVAEWVKGVLGKD